MAHLPKLAASLALVATAILAVACVATDDEAPVPQGDVAESAAAEPTSEAAEAQWGASWYQCRPWRDCVYRYGVYSCSRWMPQLAQYCGGYPGYPPGGGYPGGGYPGYPPGGGYPGGGYPGYPPGGGYPGGGYPGYPPGGGYPGGGYPGYPPGGGYPGHPGGGYPGGGYPDHPGGGHPGGGYPDHPGGKYPGHP